MPWHTVQNHSACPAGKPWAVVKDADGSVEGCHASEADADRQMAALYANEGDSVTDVDEILGGKPSPGTKKDKRLKENQAADEVEPLAAGDCPPGMDMHPDTHKCVPLDEMPATGAVETLADGDAPAVEAPAAEVNNRWVGTLAVEGVETGDQREFADGSLTWADPPLTLRWNKEDSHGGEPHTVAVAVGNIDEVWRDGNRIMGRGTFDMGQPDGIEAQRRVDGKYLRGISIDADDITDADVELIWPETGPNDGETDDEGSIFDMLFASPDKVIFHAGRIRAATLCDIPAFVEASIALDGDDAEQLAASAVQLAAVGSHGTATSDGAWDGAANEKRLPSPMPAATAKKFYAWVASGASELQKSEGKFGHHEVSGDGSPGAANLTACSSGIGILNGGRGGTSIPAGDRRGVYNHLAAHLRDAGREPPPLNATEDVVLASVTALDAWRPPRAWFANPQLTVPMNVIVTDEGRIYGHAAHFGECHIGYPDACVTAPYEDSHPYFMTGEVACDDGTRVAVGQVTVGTNHAPLQYGASRAAEHYDNTGVAVADVAVGNDAFGIWIAGAVRPHAEAARVYDLRAAGKVSGDWRRIGGQLRLVGLLGVNVAGFQSPQVKSRIASGVQVSLVAAGQVRLGAQAPTEAELAERALKLVMAQLSAKVHGTTTKEG